MQSDIVAKSGGMKTGLRIRWVKSSDLTTRHVKLSSTKNGIGISSSKNVTEQSRVEQLYEVHTDDVHNWNDRCVGLRVQPRCANAVVAALGSHTIAS